ncbi:hypothetical protein LJB83_01855, partial [Clostridia bacterium OttesenSCG-928-F22]|nr:hypothetical protein [Clostridia bacterium OttesenSCG-928-F22]
MQYKLLRVYYQYLVILLQIWFFQAESYGYQVLHANRIAFLMLAGKQRFLMKIGMGFNGLLGNIAQSENCQHGVPDLC